MFLCRCSLRLQISDVAWAPLSLIIPLGLVSLRARNASVVSVAETVLDGTYALATLVLDDNALAPHQQDYSLLHVLRLTTTLQVFSCQRCGLQLDVETIVRAASASYVNSLQELHLAQVRIRISMRPAMRAEAGERSIES